MIRIIRAFRRGYVLGQARARRRDVEFLRAQAALHHHWPGDQKRRGALNHAGDRIEQGRGVGKP